MPAPVVAAKYDELRNIAQSFNDQSEIIDGVFQRVLNQFDVLQAGAWQGINANRFFDEMESEILPALIRLTHALKKSDETVRRIITILQEGEEEAAAYFGANGGAGAGRIGGGLGTGGGFGGGAGTKGWKIEGKKGDYHLLRGMSSRGAYRYIEGNMTLKEALDYANEDPFKPDNIDAKITFYESEVSARAALAQGMIGNDMRYGFGVLEAKTGAEMTFEDGGFKITSKVGAGAYLGKVEYDAKIAGVDVAAQGYIGANVQGEASAAFGPNKAMVGAQAEAFVGGKLEGSAKKSVEMLGVEASATARGAISYGLGAKFDGAVGFDNGHFKVKIDTGLTVGLGLEGGIELDLNVQEAAESAVEVGKDVVDFVGSGISNLLD